MIFQALLHFTRNAAERERLVLQPFFRLVNTDPGVHVHEIVAHAN